MRMPPRLQGAFPDGAGPVSNKSRRLPAAIHRRVQQIIPQLSRRSKPMAKLINRPTVNGKPVRLLRHVRRLLSIVSRSARG